MSRLVLPLITALALACSNGARPPTTSETPVSQHQPLPDDAVLLKQGASHRMGDHKISVWAVYPDAGPDGVEVLHIKLVVFTPATGEESPHLLPVGGQLDVGPQRYQIVRLIPARDGERAEGAMIPVANP